MMAKFVHKTSSHDGGVRDDPLESPFNHRPGKLLTMGKIDTQRDYGNDDSQLHRVETSSWRCKETPRPSSHASPFLPTLPYDQPSQSRPTMSSKIALS